MKTKTKKEEAYILFQEGKTHAQIAKSLDLHHGTIKNWASQNKWRNKQRAECLEITTTIFSKVTVEMETNVITGLAFAGDVFQVARDGFARCAKEDSEDVGTLTMWATLGEKAAKMHRHLVPEIGDAFGEKILEELYLIKRLNTDEKLTGD